MAERQESKSLRGESPVFMRLEAARLKLSPFKTQQQATFSARGKAVPFQIGFVRLLLAAPNQFRY